jgi:hypothetical protein
MKDKWLPAGLVIALIGAMFYALYADLSRISPAPDQRAEYSYEERSQTYNRGSDKRGFWDVNVIDIATLILAGSTVGLWIATRKLWQSSERHAGHTESMIGITRGIERAYLYPIIDVANNSEIANYILRCAVFYLGDESKDDIPADILIHINFRLKNYGKTPGTIYRVYAETGFWPRSTGAQAGISIDKSILGYGEETGKLCALMWGGLSQNQVGQIRDYTGYFALSGQFIFDDIWGKKYSTEFSFFWDKDIERMTLRDLRTHEGIWNNQSQTFITDDDTS